MTTQTFFNGRFGSNSGQLQGLAHGVALPMGTCTFDDEAPSARVPDAIDTLPALAWSARPDGTADFFNRRYLDFIGYSAAQASGWRWMAAVHPEDRECLTAAWRQILDSGSPGEAEARLRRHDGEYRWFLFRVHPLRDEVGSITEWYGANTEVEDRKRAEAELLRARDRFSEAEAALSQARSELTRVTRMTALGSLTASIAHEVSQPLTGIATNASACLRMLEAKHPDVEGAREAARRILRDGNRAAAVVARLRAMFTNRDLVLETMDINEAVREVIALSVSDLRRDQVVLQAELAEGLPPIAGDRIQLQQVILNLLRNASEAMVDVQRRPRQLVLRTELDGEGRVRLVVRDSGVGLEPEGLARLFDAFYTTKAGGMGIGLFVSHSIIERHAGRIWAEANEGPGATVAFSIPVASA